MHLFAQFVSNMQWVKRKDDGALWNEMREQNLVFLSFSVYFSQEQSYN